MKKQNNLITLLKTPVANYTVEQHKALHKAAKIIEKLKKESTDYLKNRLSSGEKIEGVTYTASRKVRVWKDSIQFVMPKLIKAGLGTITVKDRKKLKKLIPDYAERTDIFDFKLQSAHQLEKEYDIKNLEKYLKLVEQGQSIKFVEEVE